LTILEEIYGFSWHFSSQQIWPLTTFHALFCECVFAPKISRPYLPVHALPFCLQAYGVIKKRGEIDCDLEEKKENIGKKLWVNIVLHHSNSHPIHPKTCSQVATKNAIKNGHMAFTNVFYRLATFLLLF
jgi:hypothetical protein